MFFFYLGSWWWVQHSVGGLRRAGWCRRWCCSHHIPGTRQTLLGAQGDEECRGEGQGGQPRGGWWDTRGTSCKGNCSLWKSGRRRMRLQISRWKWRLSGRIYSRKPDTLSWGRRLICEWERTSLVEGKMEKGWDICCRIGQIRGIENEKKIYFKDLYTLKNKFK